MPARPKRKKHHFKKDPMLTSWQRALFAPVCFFVVYFLLDWAKLFSPLYVGAHFLAWGVFALWFFLIVRAVRRTQVFEDHRFFAFVFCGFVMVGSSWGLPSDVDLRVWVTPPTYTEKPTTQLSRDSFFPTKVLAGSVLRVSSGAKEELQVIFDGRSSVLNRAQAESDVLSFTVPNSERSRRADLLVHRLWHRHGNWSLSLVPDKRPQIKLSEKPFVTTRKTIRLAYHATDDFGVDEIYVRIIPQDSVEGDKKHVDVLLASPMRKIVKDASYAELTFLPWVGEKVSLSLIAIDGAGQQRQSKAVSLQLPTRLFRHPFARALIEERRKLLTGPTNTMRHDAANVMAGIAREQGKFQKDWTSILMLRSGAVRLVISQDKDVIDKTAALLWRTAMRLEEGAMGLAREKLAKAQAEMEEALILAPEPARVKSLLAVLSQAGEKYFKALESEKSRASPVLKEFANASFTGHEASSCEYFQARMEEIEVALKEKNETIAQGNLSAMGAMIENLPTTMPELTPYQDRLAGQLSALRLLMRAQKMLLKITEHLLRLDEGHKETSKLKAVRKAREEQRELLLALKKVIAQTHLAQREVKDSERAMRGAVESLAKGKLNKAQKQQVEALALLENTLLILEDRMKQSLVQQRRLK